MNYSVNFRKDYRSIEEFQQDIKCRTKKEKFLLELFIKECQYRKQTIQAFNNGVDNSGNLVEKSNCNADYRLVIDNQAGLFEIKCSPVVHKCTFKCYHLEQYVKQGANILLFYGTGYIDKNLDNINYATTMWGIISPSKIQAMLSDCTPYIEYTFGNKKCIKIEQSQYHQYFTSEKLTHIHA